jgi:hypothetical protein
VISILQVNPIEFVGLKQAAYISRCLVNGQSKEEIARAFDGDVQLVNMWTLFVEHNHWINSLDGRWSFTTKGQRWIGKDS